MTPHRRVQLSRDVVLTMLTVGALAETAWTVYLGWRLPRHYVTNHWDLAWVGIDSVQVLMLLLAAWAAWRRRAVLILFVSISGTLLLVDAWFDVTTARYGDFDQAALSLLIEVPAALVLFWIAHRTVKRLTGTWLADTDLAVLPVRRIPITPPRANGPSEPT